MWCTCSKQQLNSNYHTALFVSELQKRNLCSDRFFIWDKEELRIFRQLFLVCDKWGRGIKKCSMIPQLNHRIRERTPEVYSWFWHQHTKSLPQHALRNGNSSRSRNIGLLPFAYCLLMSVSTGPPPAPSKQDLLTTDLTASSHREFSMIFLGEENRCLG